MPPASLASGETLGSFSPLNFAGPLICAEDMIFNSLPCSRKPPPITPERVVPPQCPRTSRPTRPSRERPPANAVRPPLILPPDSKLNIPEKVVTLCPTTPLTVVLFEKLRTLPSTCPGTCTELQKQITSPVTCPFMSSSDVKA